MKIFEHSPLRSRDQKLKADILRMAVLVEAQLRDALGALQSVPRPCDMAARRAELEHLQMIIDRPCAAGLIGATQSDPRQSMGALGISAMLVTLSARAEDIAARSVRLQRAEATALFAEPLECLGRTMVGLLGTAMRQYAAGCPSPAPLGEAVDDAVQPVVTELVGTMGARPALAQHCAELFAIAKAWERVGDLIAEIWSLTEPTTAGVEGPAASFGLRGAA